MNIQGSEIMEEKKTMMDRLKEMDSVEFSRFLSRLYPDCRRCPAKQACDESEGYFCEDGFREWLESE